MLRMKRLLSVCMAALLGSSMMAAGSSKGYDIKIGVKNLSNSKLILAYYYGDKQYVKDTFDIDAKGVCTIKADTALPAGIYLAVFPALGNKYFEFVVNEQRFALETDTTDLASDLKILNNSSLENTLFYDDMKFLQKKRKESEAMSSAFKSATDEKTKNEIREKLKLVDKEVTDKRKEIINKYPTSLYAKILHAMEPVPARESMAPRDAVGRLIDSNWVWRDYKNRYWENVDLNDDRMLRTPIFHNKLKEFYTRTIMQIPDSIIVDGDMMLKKINPKGEIFKYTLVYMLNEMAKSKIMGFDAVYVHLVKNYYSKGYATWVDSVQLYKINDRGKVLEPLLIGKKARNIVLADTTLKTMRSLYDIKNRFTILCFWDPDCSHCKKEVPKLAEVYHKMKKDGVDVEIYAPAIMPIEEMKKWTDFIREHNLDWINVGDPYRQNNFRFEWDIQSTPQLYILDKDKNIKAKRIGAEQVEDFIKHEIDPSYRPKNPPIIQDEKAV
jgi:thiol-disulfide isomerase/thioredoxin